MGRTVPAGVYHTTTQRFRQTAPGSLLVVCHRLFDRRECRVRRACPCCWCSILSDLSVLGVMKPVLSSAPSARRINSRAGRGEACCAGSTAASGFASPQHAVSTAVQCLAVRCPARRMNSRAGQGEACCAGSTAVQCPAGQSLGATGRSLLQAQDKLKWARSLWSL